METHCGCGIAGAYPTPQGGQPGSRKSWACMAAGGPGVRKAGRGIAALLEAGCEEQLQVGQGLECTVHVRRCQKSRPSGGNAKQTNAWKAKRQ